MAPKNRTVDIAANLPSLQFENALTPQQHCLLPLRTRTHAITAVSVANACYTLSVLNSVRSEVFLVKNATRAADRIMQYGLEGDPARVGIIGCGRFGRQLVRALLTFHVCKPENLFISTRRPESVVEFKEDGISIEFDNSNVASKCDVIFLCCLPSAINEVVADIKKALSLEKILYSFVSGLTTTKLKNLLNFSNIIKPELIWTEESSRKPWDITVSPVFTLDNRAIVERFCPISPQSSESPVWLDAGLVVKIIAACINYATTQAVTSDVAVEICNKAFFMLPQDGVERELLIEESFKFPEEAILMNLFEEPESDRTTYLEQTNVSMNQSSPKPVHFPYWSVADIGAGAELLDNLQMNKRLRKYFLRRFCSIFERSAAMLNF